MADKTEEAIRRHERIATIEDCMRVVGEVVAMHPPPIERVKAALATLLATTKQLGTSELPTEPSQDTM